MARTLHFHLHLVSVNVGDTTRAQHNQLMVELTPITKRSLCYSHGTKLVDFFIARFHDGVVLVSRQTIFY